MEAQTTLFPLNSIRPDVNLLKTNQFSQTNTFFLKVISTLAIANNYNLN